MANNPSNVSDEKNTTSSRQPSRNATELSPAAAPKEMGPHLKRLTDGFAQLAIASTFVAAIQSQVMASTALLDSPSAAIQAANTFYLCGMVLDLIAAVLSFLAGRWFSVLLPEEKAFLEECFDERVEERGIKGHKKDPQDDTEHRTSQKEETRYLRPSNIPIRYMASSLYSSFLMLVLGVLFLLVGLLIFTWATQPLPVAILVSCAYLAVSPFVIGIFLIGDREKRKRDVIISLSWKTGNW